MDDLPVIAAAPEGQHLRAFGTHAGKETQAVGHVWVIKALAARPFVELENDATSRFGLFHGETGILTVSPRLHRPVP